ncbi:hypothetical protein W04_0374 [Pseudoalteromonas sp. SW0106-04]|nr:hypothetical protein W04_0374 [Pseudoalteromonas sp. SW0106-04]
MQGAMVEYKLFCGLVLQKHWSVIQKALSQNQRLNNIGKA